MLSKRRGVNRRKSNKFKKRTKQRKINRRKTKRKIKNKSGGGKDPHSAASVDRRQVGPTRRSSSGKHTVSRHGSRRRAPPETRRVKQLRGHPTHTGETRPTDSPSLYAKDERPEAVQQDAGRIQVELGKRSEVTGVDMAQWVSGKVVPLAATQRVEPHRTTPHSDQLSRRDLDLAIRADLVDASKVDGLGETLGPQSRSGSFRRTAGRREAIILNAGNILSKEFIKFLSEYVKHKLNPFYKKEPYFLNYDEYRKITRYITEKVIKIGSRRNFKKFVKDKEYSMFVKSILHNIKRQLKKKGGRDGVKAFIDKIVDPSQPQG